MLRGLFNLRHPVVEEKGQKESRDRLLLATLYAEKTRSRINTHSERTREITKIKSAYLEKNTLLQN